MNVYSLIYDGLWHVAPFFIRRRLRRRARQNPAYLEHWNERFGEPFAEARKDVLWIHAVSVGETRAASPIAGRLKKKMPDLPLLVTQMTPTGRATARALFPGAQCRYLPYDRKDFVRRFLDEHRPRAAVFMETEVWPNILAECRARGIPTLLVNARMSAKSARSYRRFRSFFAPAFAGFAAVLAQTSADARRLRELGARNIDICGNSKYDIEADPRVRESAREFRRRIGDRPVWVAAGTREKDGIDEAGLLLEVWARAGDPEVLLLLVPRHPERFDAAYERARSLGLKTQKRSDGRDVDSDTRVWIGDSMGEMFAYYLAGDVAFVGGSLVDTGCQNVIEPLSCGLPTIFGFSTFNFASSCAEALEAGVAYQVGDADECVRTVLNLLREPGKDTAAKARAFIAERRGAAEKIAEHILRLLAEQSPVSGQTET